MLRSSAFFWSPSECCSISDYCLIDDRKEKLYFKSRNVSFLSAAHTGPYVYIFVFYWWRIMKNYGDYFWNIYLFKFIFLCVARSCFMYICEREREWASIISINSIFLLLDPFVWATEDKEFDAKKMFTMQKKNLHTWS